MFDWSSLAQYIPQAIQLGTSLWGAHKGSKAAKRAARQATPVPYGTNSMYGTTTVDPRTKQLGFNMAQNPFAAILNAGGLQSFGNAFAAPSQAYWGAAPEIADAARGMFGPQLEQAAAERFGLLNQLALPGEQRQTNSLLDRLNAMGRLGGTGGATEQQALAEAQSQAELQRQLAAQDWAMNRAQNRFTSALQAVGAGQAQQQQGFQMGLGSMGGISDLFKNLLAQSQQGVAAGAAGATPGDMAAGAANASMGGTNAIGNFLNNSGVFDAIGGWLGGKMGGGTLSPVNVTAQPLPVPSPISVPNSPYIGG